MEWKLHLSPSRFTVDVGQTLRINFVKAHSSGTDLRDISLVAYWDNGEQATAIDRGASGNSSTSDNEEVAAEEEEEKHEGGLGNDYWAAIVAMEKEGSSTSSCSITSDTGESDGESAASSNRAVAAKTGQSKASASRPDTEGPALDARQSRDGLPVLTADGVDTGCVIKHKPQSNDAYVKCVVHERCTRTRTLNGASVLNSANDKDKGDFLAISPLGR
eukprot:5504964-Amphidinium_carterae.6